MHRIAVFALAIVLLPLSARAEEATPPTKASTPDPQEATVLSPEPLVWPQTSRAGSGFVAPTVEKRMPQEVEVDAATRAQLDRILLRLARPGAHPEGPTLRQDRSPQATRAAAPVPQSVLGSSPGGDSLGAGLLTLFRNTTPTSTVPDGFSSTTNEPSLATKGDRVFYTMNWWAAQSTNDGTSYSSVNPFTGPYTPADAGFCCDQLAIYSPEVDALFFMQQYIEDGTDGTQRWNVDQGFDGTFDCLYDFTPATVGQGSGKWFDFADVALSRGFLFHSSNIFTTPGDAYAGAVVQRLPLAEMSTCTGFSFSYLYDASYGSFRFAQGATDTMYFAAHSTLSSMRIWKWPNSTTSISTYDRSVSSWTNDTRVCPGPDAKDWCGFIDHRMTAGFHSNQSIGFLWTPSQTTGRPFPYVRGAVFDVSNGSPSLTSQPEVWSTTIAWAYASAAVNDDGDIGGTILFGGGDTLYQGCTTWIADEQNGYVFAPLENTPSLFGSSGPSSNRSGDYLSTRRHYPNQSVFSGSCFALTGTTVATSRHARFGRADFSNALFRNGFETGNTLVWSSTTPAP